MCNKYKEADLRKRYDKKKRLTLKNRNVGFELSFEEYKTLMTKADKCDYTGENFEDNVTHLFRSIERIDKNLPYRKDNCCIVTVQANQLKDILEEDVGKIAIEHIETLLKIKDTLRSKTRLELASKYFPEVLHSGKQDSSIEEKIILKSEDVNVEQGNNHTDVEVAQAYIEFAKESEDFMVSFSMFKRKLLKTKCEFSGKTFDKKNHYLHKRITKKDYEAPFTDDNITVICLVFDNMLKNNLFTKKELLKSADNF